MGTSPLQNSLRICRISRCHGVVISRSIFLPDQTSNQTRIELRLPVRAKRLENLELATSALAFVADASHPPGAMMALIFDACPYSMSRQFSPTPISTSSGTSSE